MTLPESSVDAPPDDPASRIQAAEDAVLARVDRDGTLPLADALALVQPRPFDPEHLSAALSALLVGGVLTLDEQRRLRRLRRVVTGPERETCGTYPPRPHYLTAEQWEAIAGLERCALPPTHPGQRHHCAHEGHPTW